MASANLLSSHIFSSSAFTEGRVQKNVMGSPEAVTGDGCPALVYIADCLSCYVHLAKAGNGDSGILDVLHLAVLWWGSDEVE